MLKACIVGYGRAGKIQFEASENILDVVTIVDERMSVNKNLNETVNFSTSLEDVMKNKEITVIIVTTPTKTHYSICKLALSNGKHVFVEKPLADSLSEIEELYEIAKKNNKLLYTAYNRRHDPKWLQLKQSLDSPILFANVICRDYPYPPAAYLETCGGIIKDAAVHDLDMMCVLTNDVPVQVEAVLDERKENSSINLKFSNGMIARLIHSRHSTYYDQRVMLFCEKNMVEFSSTPNVIDTFKSRYAESYVNQIKDFSDRLLSGNYNPNISLEHAKVLEKLVEACNESAKKEEVVILKSLREYSSAKDKVKLLYKKARENQSLAHVNNMKQHYKPGKFGKMTVWQVYEKLKQFTDDSDPDVTVPNNQHALQTAESIRAANLPDWLQLVGLIHDFGKIIFQWGNDDHGTTASTQWSVVGDTFIVGHPVPETIVYPEFNRKQTSIYEEKCGLDNCEISFGHDEYLYQVLLASGTSLPNEALKIIRYHSLYVWHDKNEYETLESEYDKLLKGWVKLFNSHDLYSKRASTVNEESVFDYYNSLIEKYIPNGLNF